MVTRKNNGKNKEQWKLEKNILLLFSLKAIRYKLEPLLSQCFRVID